MNSPPPMPFFDGHNDALLRLWKRKSSDAARAFIDGEEKGQLDLPKAVQGGFAGGMFAIFVPSLRPASAPPGAPAADAAPVPDTAPGSPMPPPLDLATAQAATFSMASILIAHRARGGWAFPHLPHGRGYPAVA